MEVSSWLDAEFKLWLSGCSMSIIEEKINSVRLQQKVENIKENQSELKKTKMKIALISRKLDETENQVSGLEDKVAENTEL